MLQQKYNKGVSIMDSKLLENENETLKSILNTSLTFKQKIVIYRIMKRNALLQKLHDDILTCKELTFSDYLQAGRREKESIQYYTLSDISDHLRDVILLRE